MKVKNFGVIYHRIDHQIGMEHFDPFTSNSIVLLILSVEFTCIHHIISWLINLCNHSWDWVAGSFKHSCVILSGELNHCIINDSVLACEDII